MVPEMVAVPMIDDPEKGAADGTMIRDPAAIGLMLRSGTRTDGVGDIDEDTGLGDSRA